MDIIKYYMKLSYDDLASMLEKRINHKGQINRIKQKNEV